MSKLDFLIDLLDFLTQSSLRCEFRKNIIIQIIKTAVQIFASSNTLSEFKEARDGPPGDTWRRESASTTIPTPPPKE